MAGAGSKLFTSGSVLTADQVNTYLMDQTIMKFSSTSTRDAAFGGAGEATLSEGMFAYTSDTDTLWFYSGSTWEVATVKPSIVDAKGDLLVGTAADTLARQAVGSNGQVLTADSTETNGVKWASPSLIKIAGETTFSGATNVYVNDIFTSSYNFYRVVVRYYTSASGNSLMMRLQGVAGNYNYQTIDAGNVTVAASRSTGQTEWNIGGATNGAYWAQSVVELGFPNTAEPTTMLCHAHRNAGAYTSPDYQGRAGNQSNSTAYYGIELLVGSGTMTGSYTVYGYTK